MLARSKRYALILMDMRMPRLGGIEATQLIRTDSLNNETPIIAMTANAFEEDQRQCLSAGMDDYISKPLNSQRLFGIVLKWMSTKR